MARTEREYTRFAHQAELTFHVGNDRLAGHTENVSRGGLCAHTSAPIAIGAEIELDLVLVFEDDVQSEPLRVPARVVWCTTLDDGNQIGVAFKSLDGERAEYLNMFMRYLDDRRAEKRPRAANIDDRFR